MSNHKLDHLRLQHPEFIYESYDFQPTATGLKITFTFHLGDALTFKPTLTLENVTPKVLEKINPTHLENLIFHLGLVELISYWKVACSPTITIQAGQLTQPQLDWWYNLLIKGLGEFFYTNQIDFTEPNFVTWQSTGPSLPPNETKTNQISNQQQILVPLGGGKDSLVSLEILKRSLAPELKLIPFALNPIPAVKQTLTLHPELQSLTVKRSIDPLLLELNQQNYFNGHTPFSAYLAFLTTLVAYLFNIPLIAVSNEESANECNTTFKGHEINHQYSKSFEFEELFQRYCQKYLDFPGRPTYFSFLRPLTEIQIAQLFAQYGQSYFELFRSCNVGQKEGIWCHHCSKCLFAFLMLFPFIDEQILTEQIFQHNLFEDDSLIETALKLVKPDETKPFDCVGSYEESQVAFYLAIQKYQQHLWSLPKMLQQIQAQVIQPQSDWEKRSQHLLSSWNPQHSLPPFLNSLLTTVQQLTGKKIALFGLGREGLSSYHLLRQLLPSNQPLTLVDQATTDQLSTEVQRIIKDDQAVTYQPDLPQSTDLLIKSAGISPFTTEFKQASNYTQWTSATQLFFDLCPGTIIGVTGTKGKSTTTALIHHLLNQAFPDVRLAGNIGIPMLDTLDHSTAQTLFVVELSSHQLVNLTKSPHLAVIQAITPEHLDYYPDFDTYVHAKSNIALHQSPNDWVFYNHNSDMSTDIAIQSPAHHVGFGQEMISQYHQLLTASSLRGEHNQLNSLPAILIGKHFQLSDSQIQQALHSFQPLPHRLETVTEKEGVLYVNDSLATTPEATIEALKAFSDKSIILIAGGFDRGLDYTELVHYLYQHPPKQLILFPDTGIIIQELINHYSVSDKQDLPTLPTAIVYSMSEAVQLARQLATQNDVVLLSPAAASFNLFKDYADRGNQFKSDVTKLS